MKPFFLRRNAAISSLLALLLLSGCGGGGGGSKALTPAERSAKAFKNANVEGSFDTPDKAQSRAAVPTVITVHFADDNSGTGVASFRTGTASAPLTFASYAADISNLTFTITGSTSTVVSGTVDFDLSNFTSNKYFASTAHFKGKYSVGSTASDKLAITGGTFTGKDGKGNPTTVTVANFSYQASAAAVDLSGTYSGTVTLPLVGDQSFSGAAFKKSSGDGLHLGGTVPLSAPGSTVAGITFSGSYTGASLSGSFIPSKSLDFGDLFPIPADAVGQIYLSTTDGGKTFDGTFVVQNSDYSLLVLGGGFVPVVGTIHGVKGTSSGGGGTTSALANGFYNGTITPGGGAATNLYLDVRNASSTAGSNGAAVVGGTVITGGQVSTVTSSGGLVTTKIVGITGARDTVTLVGKVQSGTYFGDYTATTDAGGAETGSFSVDFVNNDGPFSLAGSYAGVLDSSSPSGQHSDVSLTVAQSGDVLTFSSSDTLDGLPLAGIKAVLAFDNVVSETTVAVSGGNVKLSLYGNRRADGGIDLNYTLYGPTGTVSDSGLLQVSKS